MADTTTELEVLDEIVDVLGGQGGQYETVVPTLQQIRDLLGGGGGGGGYNPSLSVGRADALTGADDTAQWATRESTGSGAATVRRVQGAAVVWNQLNNNDMQTQTNNGLTATNNGDDSWTLNGTPTAQVGIDIFTNRLFLANHKYLVKGCPAGGSNEKYFFYFLQSSVDYGSGGFKTPTADTTGHLRFIAKVGTSFDNVVMWPQVFDLTQMFGSGNEPTTVAEFEAMYPEAYYPYSEPTLKPVQVAGIASTDAQGGELDSVEWTAQTLRAAGSVADMLYSDHVDVNVGVVDLGTLTWTAGSDSVRQVFFANIPDLKYVTDNVVVNATCPGYVAITKVAWSTTDINTDNVMRSDNSAPILYFRNMSYTTAADFKAAMSGVLLYYELATPTTQPISPALPMTYRVQQGGSESIIVPDGEVSAAPVLTVAEGESAGELVMDALACIATPDGPVATANHSVGTYLTMQGKLYKVTSAIAVGETIKAGTNISETTVMAELIALTQ